MLKKIIMKVCLFTNFSSTRFAHPNHPKKPGNDEHCQWDSVPYSFEPGQSQYLEIGIAATLAKHLIIREGHKKGLDSIRGFARDGHDPLSNRLSKTKIDEMRELCLGSEIIEVSSPQEVFELTRALIESEQLEKEIEPANEPEKEVVAEKKKPGRPKKQLEEDNFEGLTE